MLNVLLRKLCIVSFALMFHVNAVMQFAMYGSALTLFPLML